MQKNMQKNVEENLKVKIQDKKWYALFVKTGEEENVKSRIMYRLGDKDINVIVPKRCVRERRQGKWENKIRILFPGYILLNGNISYKDYEFFNNVPGVIKLLKDGEGPQEISKHEISIISQLIQSGDTIGFSNAHFEGERIVITSGPLHGMDGYIMAIDKRKGRAKVRLNIMGQPRVVELSIVFVLPA